VCAASTCLVLLLLVVLVVLVVVVRGLTPNVLCHKHVLLASRCLSIVTCGLCENKTAAAAANKVE
jgi:hypothetical protein